MRSRKAAPREAELTTLKNTRFFPLILILVGTLFLGGCRIILGPTGGGVFLEGDAETCPAGMKARLTISGAVVAQSETYNPNRPGTDHYYVPQSSRKGAPVILEVWCYQDDNVDTSGYVKLEGRLTHFNDRSPHDSLLIAANPNRGSYRNDPPPDLCVPAESLTEIKEPAPCIVHSTTRILMAY